MVQVVLLRKSPVGRVGDEVQLVTVPEMVGTIVEIGFPCEKVNGLPK